MANGEVGVVTAGDGTETLPCAVWSVENSTACTGAFTLRKTFAEKWLVWHKRAFGYVDIRGWVGSDSEARRGIPGLYKVACGPDFATLRIKKICSAPCAMRNLEKSTSGGSPRAGRPLSDAKRREKRRFSVRPPGATFALYRTLAPP